MLHSITWNFEMSLIICNPLQLVILIIWAGKFVCSYLFDHLYPFLFQVIWVITWKTKEGLDRTGIDPQEPSLRGEGVLNLLSVSPVPEGSGRAPPARQSWS